MFLNYCKSSNFRSQKENEQFSKIVGILDIFDMGSCKNTIGLEVEQMNAA
jgi:hypothetical protein